MCCANTGYQWTIEDFLFNRGPFQPSLDAIVPKQGHMEGNIQWICWFTNSTNNDKKKNENVDYSLLLQLAGTSGDIIYNYKCLQDGRKFRILRWKVVTGVAHIQSVLEQEEATADDGDR